MGRLMIVNDGDDVERWVDDGFSVVAIVITVSR